MKFFKLIASSGLLLLLLVSSAKFSFAATYWVTTGGNNSNDCLSQGSACKSIHHAASLASKPGDIVNITSGTYKENGDGLGAKFFAETIGIKLNYSGTASEPITIQAAPGHEGKVIIDLQQKYLGIYLAQNDYITIQNLQIINARLSAIHSRGTSADTFESNKFSVGVKILNNYIYNTVFTESKAGGNVQAIRMDQAAYWTVRNNRIDRVTINGALNNHASGILSYNYYNVLFENNHFSNANTAIAFKRHNGNSFLEIKNNLFSNLNKGVTYTISSKVPSINSYIHHNIMYDVTTGINIRLSSVNQSVNMRVEHNIFDGGRSGSRCILNDAFQKFSLKGNIFVNCNQTSIELLDFGKPTKPSLLSSDYNVFSGNFMNVLDAKSANAKQIRELSTWQSLNKSQFITLGVSNPDLNSTTASPASIFKNIAARNYTLALGSAASNLMLDGTNAGPYQNGTERIGLLAGYPKYVEIVRPETLVLR